MRRLAALAIVLLIALQCAVAQDVAVSLDGERFTKKFVGRPPRGAAAFDMSIVHAALAQ